MANKTVNGNTLEVPSIDSKKVEIRISTIFRLLFLVAAYVNQACDVMGAYDFIMDQKTKAIVSVISLTATAVASIAAYWFNNSWTPEATVADKILQTIKESATYCPDIIDAMDKLNTNINKNGIAMVKTINDIESDKTVNLKPPRADP